jgi:HlyD family secretion protein
MSETLIEYDDLLDSTDHRRRNRLIGLAVLGVLIAAGAYALWAIALGGGGSSSAEIQTATVELGSISQTLTTTGIAVAQSTADLAFEQAGTVSAVNATLGQDVKQGDVLAEIEADDLQSALTAAEVNLDSAQAQLDELLGGSTESDLASSDQSLLQAQTNLEDAQSALEDILNGASESELRTAEQAVAAAESQLAKAEESRENLYTNSEDAIAAAEDAVAKAEDALATSKLSLLNAADTYCDTEDHLLSICVDFTIPLTDAEMRQLTNSIADDISSADPTGDDVQIAAVDPTPTPQPTPEPTPEPLPTGTPDAEPTPTPETETDTETQTETDTSNQAEPGSNLAQVTGSLISANISYTNAVANLQAAQDDVKEAQKGPSSTDVAAADVDVAAAQLALDGAKEDLDDLKAGPTQDDLDDAQNNVDAAIAALAVAQAKWNDVYDGADAQDISLQREQVRQAEEAVEKAQEHLEKAQLIAPFDGTVAELNVDVGDEVGAAAEVAIVLNTPGALRLQLTFTESDVLNVEAGQTGIATFEALENAVFPIEIESVGTNPTSTQGVVTYEAWAKVLSAPAAVGGPGLGSGSRTAILATAAEILGMTEEEVQAALQSGQTLVEIAEAQGMSAEDFQAALVEQARGAGGTGSGPPESTATPTPTATPSAADSGSSDTADATATPLPGMNASVTIILDSAQNVLTVPESAVQTEGPNSVVEVQKDDGTTEKVVVQTGLSDGSNIEITEGLEEGQTVIIPARAASSTSATQTTGFPQGGFIISGEGAPPSGGAGPSFQSAP